MLRNILLLLTSCLLFGVAVSTPPLSRGLLPHLSNGCVQDCVQLYMEPAKIELANATNFGRQMLRIGGMCSAVHLGRECVEKCNTPINPFEMRAMQTMCDPAVLSELDRNAECYLNFAEPVNAICLAECGPQPQLPSQLASNRRGPAFDAKLSSVDQQRKMRFVGDGCQTTQCHARCNRAGFDELCRRQQPLAGQFLQRLLEGILIAMNRDLAALEALPAMRAHLPGQCHYLLEAGKLFGGGSWKPIH